MAGRFRPLHQAVARLEAALQQAREAPPDAPRLRRVPGAGPALAPRILVAFGPRRERFAHTAAVAKFYGVAPVVVPSGNPQTGQLPDRGPKFGRPTFPAQAGCALQQEPGAKGYDAPPKARSQAQPHQAGRALADNRVRLGFACGKQRQPDAGQRCLNALETPARPRQGKLEKPGAKPGE